MVKRLATPKQSVAAGDDALCLGNSCSTIAVVSSQSALFIIAAFFSHPPLKLTT